jgi:hypothetical protein
VQLYVAGEHQVFVGGWRVMPKSKLVSPFQSPAQSMPCYVWRCTTISRKAAINVLVPGEILRCALLMAKYIAWITLSRPDLLVCMYFCARI